MPSAEKVSWAKLRVGIVAMVALTLLFIMVFLLTGNKSLFASDVPVYTYMDDSAAMTEGSAVRLNGIEIGKLKKIELSGENKPNRIVRLTMAIDDRMLKSIPVDSQAAVGAENLLGSKYINIRKGKQGATIVSGSELPSLDTREFQDLVNAAYPTLQSMQGIATRIDKIVGIVESGQGSIGKLLVDDELYNVAVNMVADVRSAVKDARSAVVDVQKMTSYVAEGKGSVGKVLYDETLYNDFRASLAKVDKMLADVEAGQGSAGKFLKDPALFDESKKTILEMKKMAEDLNQGKGTMGKLLKDDELSKRMNNLLAKLDTTVEKINAGQGTIGQLMVNPQLYESLNGTAKEMNSFMKDFRANPKKFLSIQLKLF